ncbi:MAG TPA: phasin family protein [Burkholderiales bacterium]|nr:phasin family protein [Burkholderiales bacterium]
MSPDLFMQAWKAQLDAGMRVFEAMTEGAMRVWEAQLEAATEAHADVEATRKAIAAAADVPQVMKLCADWARANTEKSLACCRSFADAVAETDKEVAKCVATPITLPQGVGAGLGMVDSAYRQWLQGVQRIYQSAARPGA